MRIGIFGGTFDPPHNGHLILASEAVDQLKLDRLFWVLTPDPPHKSGQVVLSLSDRILLLQTAIKSNPAFELSQVEINRPGPHYAADTMQLLSKSYPKDELYYLIGGDSLHDLPYWHHPQRLIEACSGLGVMRRPQDRIDIPELEEDLPGINQKLFFIQAPLLEISSRDIRSRIRDHRPYRYFLLPEVFAIIQEKQLYYS